MLRLACEQDELSVVSDQFGAPTGADLLADATAHAVRTVAHTPGTAGTYHVAAHGETSRFDYARVVIEGARARGWRLEVRPEAVRPVSTGDYPTVARRSRNFRLECTAFLEAFDLRLPPWQRGVERLLEELAPRDLH